MNATVTIRSDRFDALINKLRGLPDIRINGKPLRTDDAIKAQAGLLARELMRRTPPTVNRGSRGKGRTDQKIGMAAVKRDIGNAMEPLRPIEWRNKKIAKAFRDNDAQSAQAILRNIRGDKKLTVFPDFDHRFHTNFRDSRGRVQRTQHRATLAAKDWDNYVRIVQARVGRMKSGWAPAAVAAGERVPAWVAKHQAKPGYAHDMTKHPTEPSFILLNAARGIRDMAHIVRRALLGREKALAGNIRWRLRELAKAANAT